MTVAIILLVFIGILVALGYLTRGRSLPYRVLAGLLTGIAIGFALQLVPDPATPDQALEWINVVGDGYVSLLRMVVMPLVLVMMIASVLNMRDLSVLGRTGALVVAILVGTTMIAALVGIAMTNLFGLTADGLVAGERELAELAELGADRDTLAAMNFPEMLVSLLPQNVFLDLTGARDTSIIAVVIFGILFGIAALLVANEDERRGAAIHQFTETTQTIVIRLVGIVMALTPFGILALMTRVVAGSSASDILALLGFIVASYLAIAIMFAVHALLLALHGTRPLDFFRKAWPVLAFAFSSRSSAATIPLNVRAQMDELAVPQPVANIAASFGATIGQNGCAGIYPAMLATMVAPTVGVDPLDPSFIAGLTVIVAISSFGIAGVGGGATFAALVVLPAMGFPVTIAALLISIEPLIDMARTALNVSGSMTAGVLTSRYCRTP
ncbi:MAG: cation:dicarboxylase symporter family transporter [Gammaproteobacteria bacterium]|jgi:L-cystine uptake protein TcyP (sodium:dicarboxylate symporter family)